MGGGAKTEDGKIIPMDVKVGDKVLWQMVRQKSKLMEKNIA